jgi:phage tail tape-measure protein
MPSPARSSAEGEMLGSESSQSPWACEKPSPSASEELLEEGSVVGSEVASEEGSVVGSEVASEVGSVVGSEVGSEVASEVGLRVSSSPESWYLSEDPNPKDAHPSNHKHRKYFIVNAPL